MSEKLKVFIELVLIEGISMEAWFALLDYFSSIGENNNTLLNRVKETEGKIYLRNESLD